MLPVRTVLALRAVLLLLAATCAFAARAEVVDLPTRPGVTERLIFLSPPAPRAAVVLLTGGDGDVLITPGGGARRGGNFLVRSRELFVQQGLAVAVVDAPSDRQSPPYLRGFRQTPEHVADLAAVIAWLRERTQAPVWLVGTSRSTQSVAYAGIALAGTPQAPDGIVLTSTILVDTKSRPVPAMPLQRLSMPVLVVHHVNDGCDHCPFAETATLMSRLTAAPRKELIPFEGGTAEGPPCEAHAYHGYNGIEAQVVQRIAEWLTQRGTVSR